MDSILDGLNEAQKAAVTSPAKVLQILAPPGSGKTKTLLSRVAFLVSHEELQPSSIIVCTFTVKAAREMKERISCLVGQELSKHLVLGTFHSIARRYLVAYGQYVGIEKNFGVADKTDGLAIVKRIVKQHDFSQDPATTLARISKCKTRGILPSTTKATRKEVNEQEFWQIFDLYQVTLAKENLLDYDDLLLRCLDLLQNHPTCTANIQAVLVDEFQDTNVTQYGLMTQFARHCNRITIVGDPDQSIYAFRCAEIGNLRKMRAEYDTCVENLEKNYRSAGAILQAAQTVIEQDMSRPQKQLVPTHCRGTRPVLRKLPSAQDEARWVVNEIQRSVLLTSGLLNYSDFAVLLRAATVSRHLELELGKAGIPYRMVGGKRFFDRAEVKTVLDYLRVVSQPKHNDALLRIINKPKREIGEATVSRLLEEADASGISLWEHLLRVAQGNWKPKCNVSRRAMTGIESFVNIILITQNKAALESTSLVTLIETVLKRTAFESFLRRDYPEDFDSRWANVNELISQAFETEAAISEGALEEEQLTQINGVEQRSADGTLDKLVYFLGNVALSTDLKEQDDSTAKLFVTLSTIHAAKGLEWPVVFIPNAYEGIIPHSREENHDEERRLLYVGMTRAQCLLYISAPVRTGLGESPPICPFLTDPKVLRLFSESGPDFFDTALTEDLGQILRRGLPQSESLPESILRSRNAPHLVDDYYPLDGSEPLRTSYWDNTASGQTNGRKYLGQKTYTGRQAETETTVAERLSLKSNTVAVTTVYPTFTTAGACLNELSTDHQRMPLNTATVFTSQRNVEVPSKKGKVKGRNQNTDISLFFTSTAKAASVDVNNALVATSEVVDVQRMPSKGANEDVARVTSFDREVHSQVCMEEPPRKRLRTTPLNSRPINSQSSHAQSDKYVLLSSSPPPHGDNDAGKNGQYHRMEAAEATIPAVTLHSTTVMQVAAPQSGKRRVLGIKRSLHGWTCKGSAFKPP